MVNKKNDSYTWTLYFYLTNCTPKMQKFTFGSIWYIKFIITVSQK